MRRELVELALAVVILATVATLAYRSINTATETLGWVERANRVLQQIADVSATYARSASARRAYVVAGDESQLAETPELDERLKRALSDVRDSLADEPAQRRRLDTLAPIILQRLAGLDAAVERRRREGVGVESAEGLALTARIRTVREEMESEENRLLAERDRRTREVLARTKIAEVIGTLVSFAMLFFAFRRLRREVDRRRQSEHALRASERFLDSIVENIPDMIFVKDASELRFERINRAGEELLGIDRATVIRKNDFDFFPRAQAESFQARDRETIASGVVFEVREEPIQTKSGERWLHTRKVPLFDEQGAPKYLLGISEDVTERRKAAAALKTAKDAADAANQELEAFSYSVAHDLRAPLRAIDGFSQALEEDCADKLDAQNADHLKRVRGAARHMAELIDGLLGLSRVTRGDLVRQTVDLTRAARQTAARLQAASPERQVEIVIADSLVVDGDARLLGSVLDNLIGNAWKFTGKSAHARIEVGSRTDEDGTRVLFVRDNGAGFEQAYAHKLFGAFQRLHTASDFEGSGIGLATVQRIVRRHGGRIWAEGSVGHGATFYFTL